MKDAFVGRIWSSLRIGTALVALLFPSVPFPLSLSLCARRMSSPVWEHFDLIPPNKVCTFVQKIKDCNGTQYDIQEAACCENKLHPGSNLFCCGKEPYNPGTATCCKVQHGKILTASVIQGLSEKVSKCCDLKAYNPVNEICCQSSIISKPGPMAECCGKDVFDKDKQLCCGPAENKTILVRNSRHHECCGHSQYDTETQCCCSNEEKLEIQSKDSSCCVKNFTPEAINEDKQLCCQINKTITRTSSLYQCCGSEEYNTETHCCDSELQIKPLDVFDKDKQLCCGPADNKTILVRNSRHHECCGHSQYDTETQCCCSNEEKLEIQSKNSPCCVKNFTPEIYDMENKLCCGPNNDKKILTRKSRDHVCCHHGQFNVKTECCCYNNHSAEVQLMNSSCCMKQQIFKLQPKCTEPNTHLCGSSCYNPKQNRCCESNHEPHSLNNSGQRKATATVYNPHTQVCCDGRVSPWKPWIDQFHGSPGQHCCGTEIYRPRTEICCNGHRHLKSENIHCCGVKAYNIKDPQMKCCAGTLYNLTSLDKHGGDAQCCGSILQKPQDICCSSEDKEVLYSAKTGFKCCGHLYYNTTLWSCCAGGLRRIHEPGQDQRKMINGSRLLSVNNLNKIDLCKEMHIGTVESVSLQSIVFRSVLMVHGMEAKVKALPFPYILERDDRCSSPKLIAGKTYYFNRVNVFIDFNHDSVLQSLHFIISKCSSQVTTS
ncbi:regulatory factor X 1/2/3 [Sarotherodon galilaeus]